MFFTKLLDFLASLFSVWKRGLGLYLFHFSCAAIVVSIKRINSFPAVVESTDEIALAVFIVIAVALVLVAGVLGAAALVFTDANNFKDKSDVFRGSAIIY